MIRRATLNDLKYIDSLRKKESKAIGFIPLARYEMEITGERHGTILVYEENADLVGFLYATHNQSRVTHIQQIAIQEDARRLECGKSLVEAARKNGDWLLSCRCAADLESTAFWQGIGFQLLDEVTPKSVYGKGKEKATLPASKKRQILRFQKIVSGLWFEETRNGNGSQ